MLLAVSVSVLVSLSIVAPAPARTVLLGRSWQGRPIRAVEVGNPAGTRVLVVGCIHGNETAGIAIADALEHLAPRDLDLWIVPDLNPDGVAAGTLLPAPEREDRPREPVLEGFLGLDLLPRRPPARIPPGDLRAAGCGVPKLGLACKSGVL